MSKLSKEEIMQTIKETIVEISETPISVEDIEDGDKGIEKLGLNSISYIRLNIELERKFDIDMDVDEEDSEILLSVEKLAGYIQDNMNE